jgi:hypothetical protein
MEATKAEDQERATYERKLAQKSEQIADLEARNHALAQSLARAQESEEHSRRQVKEPRSSSGNNSNNGGNSASGSSQQQRRWEVRARKMEEEFYRVRDQLETELAVASESRQKARDEFERLLGRKANPADARIVQILEGFVQEQLRGLKTQVPPPALRSTVAMDDQTVTLTARSRDEVRDFAKRVCELVLAHTRSTEDADDANDFLVSVGDEDLVDEKGWFPTKVVARVIPQISRWISQSEEVDRLRFWRDQILKETRTTNEEAALRSLRKALTVKNGDAV